jgi:HEAT repeat protein
VIGALARIAASKSEPEISLQAISALRKLAVRDEEAEAALVKTFKSSDDRELRISVVEALGDMKSQETASLAAELIEEGSIGVRRVLYALSQVGGEKDVSAILDAAGEKELGAFIEKLLEDLEPDAVLRIIRQRQKSEKDDTILELMEAVAERLESSY